MRRFLTTCLLAASLSAQGLQLTTGIDGYVDFASSPLFNPPTGLTVEAWVTYNDATVPTGTYYWPTIVRQNVSPGQEAYILRIGAANTGNRNIEFTVRNAANALNVLSYTFAAGALLNWTHLAGTFDGTVMRIYMNGIQVATRTIGLSEIQNSGGLLRIGAGDPSNPGHETWNGDIDEVRIWPFARTQGEIQATMGQELMSMPGKVLTFNFNGNHIETSHGLVGTPTGVVNFSAAGAPISMMMPVALNVGTSTTTCARTIDTHLGSLPTLGNTNFAIWATQGPRPANSPLGLAVAGTTGAPPGQPAVFGIQLAMNFPTIFFTQALLPPTTQLGNTRLPLPIPNLPQLMGTSLIFQFGYADTTCGPQGYSASDGIVFGIM